MDPWEVAAWPWTVMAVSRTGAVYLSTVLAELLGVPPVPPPNWADAFEFATASGEPVLEPVWPWRRAARGELFTERQVWVHRQHGTRYTFRLEAALAGEFVLLRFEDESERLLGRRLAGRLDGLAAALLRAEPAAIVREAAACVDAEAAFWMEPDRERRELRWVVGVGLPDTFGQGLEAVPVSSGSIIAEASRTLDLTEAPRLETHQAQCPVTRHLVPLGFRSMVALPLATDRAPGAVLVLVRRHAGREPAIERAVLRAMRAAILRAMARAREETADREAHARVRRVQDAAGSLRGELPFKDLLSQMAEQARALTQAERATLDVGQERQVVAPPPPAPPLPAWLLTVPLKLGPEVMGHFRLEKSAAASPFTREDAQRLASFAAQVAPVVGYAREALWAEAERLYLDSVLQQAPDGIVFVDTRSEPSSVRSNAAAERILGQALRATSVEEMPAKFGLHDPSGRLLTPDELPQRRALRGEVVVDQEILVRRKDGDVTIRANAAPVRSQQGLRLGAVAVFQDITAFKTLHRLREEFAAVVAHDLKTPLHAMLLRLDRLERGVEGEERALVVQLRAGAERLARLVDDLSDVSRLEVSQLPLYPEPLSLETAVRELVEQIRPTLDGRCVQVEVEPGLPPFTLDPVRLDQILTNLITNATKHSAPGQPIDVTVRRDGAGALLQFRDRGDGIPADELPHLFERFFQGSRARATPGGMGLGLFITRRLVEAHGGRLGVQSAAGEGSTFWVWLPETPPAPA